MMFKKGSFEIGATIYPVAMKVRQLHHPCFTFHSTIFLHDVLMFLTFFLVQPEVWGCVLEQLQVQHGQLPGEDDDQLGHRLRCLVHASHAPEGDYRSAALVSACVAIKLSTCIFMIPKWQEGEDAIQFANRVKSAIAHQGGLVDLQWWEGLAVPSVTPHLL